MARPPVRAHGRVADFAGHWRRQVEPRARVHSRAPTLAARPPATRPASAAPRPVAAHVPELEQATGQSQARRRRRPRPPAQRRPQVVVLGLQPVQPGRLVGPGSCRLGPLGQRQAPGRGGARARPRASPASPQPLPGVLAHRLQQPVARLRRRRASASTSDLSTSRSSRSSTSPASMPSPGADRLGRLQRPAAGEDRQPAQQRPLRLGQQVVAPVDRRRAASAGAAARSGCRRSAAGSGRPAAPRSARPAGAARAPPPARAPAGCRPAAGRSAPPPPRSGRSARSRGCAAAPARRTAAPPRTGAELRRAAAGRCGVGQRQRRARARRPRRRAERLAAGGQDAQVRAAAQQRVGQRGAGVEQVLAVVQHQQQALGRAGAGQQCRQERLAGLLAHAERRRRPPAGTSAGSASGGQLDQPDAVGVGVAPARRRPAAPGGSCRSRPRRSASAGGSCASSAVHLGHLALAPDEAGQLQRQVVRRSLARDPAIVHSDDAEPLVAIGRRRRTHPHHRPPTAPPARREPFRTQWPCSRG